jgi:hypothetical protein
VIVAEEGGAGVHAGAKGDLIWVLGGEVAHRGGLATVRGSVAEMRMAVKRTVGCWCSSSSRRGSAGVGDPHGAVSGAGAGRTVANIEEMWEGWQQRGERPCLVSLAGVSGMKLVLLEEEIEGFVLHGS